ncbi:hypothetical protein B0H66DRAFT_625767 [Apodospora peruviana]|uniref:Uncharacterized protein n=1 Tax=Apodospora peruviana TaxID=516989 RepID=A0AAE0I150_9PEZI|nr:hypothetical protein B0H66DRAFT_625767 [Apodospora peruviana]
MDVQVLTGESAPEQERRRSSAAGQKEETCGAWSEWLEHRHIAAVYQPPRLGALHKHHVSCHQLLGGLPHFTIPLISLILFTFPHDNWSNSCPEIHISHTLSTHSLSLSILEILNWLNSLKYKLTKGHVDSHENKRLPAKEQDDLEADDSPDRASTEARTSSGRQSSANDGPVPPPPVGLSTCSSAQRGSANNAPASVLPPNVTTWSSAARTWLATFSSASLSPSGATTRSSTRGLLATDELVPVPTSDSRARSTRQTSSTRQQAPALRCSVLQTPVLDVTGEEEQSAAGPQPPSSQIEDTIWVGGTPELDVEDEGENDDEADDDDFAVNNTAPTSSNVEMTPAAKAAIARPPGLQVRLTDRRPMEEEHGAPRNSHLAQRELLQPIGIVCRRDGTQNRYRVENFRNERGEQSGRIFGPPRVGTGLSFSSGQQHPLSVQAANTGEGLGSNCRGEEQVGTGTRNVQTEERAVQNLRGDARLVFGANLNRSTFQNRTEESRPSLSAGLSGLARAFADHHIVVGLDTSSPQAAVAGPGSGSVQAADGRMSSNLLSELTTSLPAAVPGSTVLFNQDPENELSLDSYDGSSEHLFSSPQSGLPVADPTTLQASENHDDEPINSVAEIASDPEHISSPPAMAVAPPASAQAPDDQMDIDSEDQPASEHQSTHAATMDSAQASDSLIDQPSDDQPSFTGWPFEITDEDAAGYDPIPDPPQPPAGWREVRYHSLQNIGTATEAFELNYGVDAVIVRALGPAASTSQAAEPILRYTDLERELQNFDRLLDVEALPQKAPLVDNPVPVTEPQSQDPLHHYHQYLRTQGHNPFANDHTPNTRCTGPYRFAWSPDVFMGALGADATEDLRPRETVPASSTAGQRPQGEEPGSGEPLDFDALEKEFLNLPDDSDN